MDARLKAGHDESNLRVSDSGSRRMCLAEALQRGGGIRVSFLQLDAPIAELVERDGAPGHRAAHEVAGRQHLHLAVEIFQLGFALEADVAFEAVHQIEVACLSLLWITID